jgi:hypothetical protein
MATTEPDYDAMDEAMADEPLDLEEDSGLDAELLMHAESAGFDAVKAEALKAFVERCVELKSTDSYDVLEDEEVDDIDEE